MRRCATIYRAIHNETGEVHEGNAKELGQILHVVPNTINKAALEQGKVGGYWNISKSLVPPVKKDVHTANCKFPQELLNEWDAVTKPFKDASNAAKNNIQRRKP